MYVHPEARLNGFKLVKIPSNAELFRTVGPKMENSHDGSNGDNWIEPDNFNGVDNLDMIARAENELSAEAIRHQRASSEADRANYVEESKQDEPKQDEPSATS